MNYVLHHVSKFQSNGFFDRINKICRIKMDLGSSNIIFTGVNGENGVSIAKRR